MEIIRITKAREQLFELVDEANQMHAPIEIVGKKNSAVLISKKDWENIEETLFINSIPELSKSIIEGLKTNIKDCETSLEW